MGYQQGDTYYSNIYISVEGLSDTLHKISKYDYETQEKIVTQVDKYAKLIKRAGKNYAPKDTGALAKSITIKKFFQGTAAHIFPSDKKIKKSRGHGQSYRHFQEYGTGERWTKYTHPIYGNYRGSAPPTYYMKKARLQYEGSFENEIRKIVNKEVII